MVGLLKLIGKRARQEIFICQAFFLLNKAQVFGELAGYLECQTNNPPPSMLLPRKSKFPPVKDRSMRLV